MVQSDIKFLNSSTKVPFPRQKFCGKKCSLKRVNSTLIKFAMNDRSGKQMSHKRNCTRREPRRCSHGEDPIFLQIRCISQLRTSGIKDKEPRELTGKKNQLSRTAPSTLTKRGSVRMTLDESNFEVLPTTERRGWLAW